MTGKQTSEFPQAKDTFSNWNRVSQNEISARKNLKPVAVSFLLINSEITGRLEMKVRESQTHIDGISQE